MAMNTQQQNWAGEVMPPAADWTRPTPPVSGTASRPPMNGTLQMQNHLPSEVIESPTTANEAYLGSLKAMLLRNRGNYIVATFLIGTQNTVSWEGILYEVGNDYVTIYQPGRDRYVVCDMYSIKYMEFYDTQRRRMCDELMARQGMNQSGNMDYLASTPQGW